VISSASNPRVKQFRSLRMRKERERTGQFIVEGIRIVAEAVDMEAKIECCLFAPELLNSEFALRTVERLRSGGVPCLEATAEVFESLSAREGPQGIAAIVRQRWEALDEIEPGGELCWVALHEARDPGNLGTVLRTVDAVGGAGVVLIGSSTDPYDPTAIRSSMGAIFSQRLARGELVELLAWKQRTGLPLIGTSDGAPDDFRSVSYRSPLVLLMGSERAGLSFEQQAMCDLAVRIPMMGRSDSLNLAVATGVILYEIFDQHFPTSPQT